MPLGSLLALLVAQYQPTVIAAFLSFGLIALRHPATEELLVEAHEKPDSLLISALVFIGFSGCCFLKNSCNSDADRTDGCGQPRKSSAIR